MTATVVGSDGLCRCAWVTAAPDFQRYHDTEWGRPDTDSRALWEKLILDGFQAGLAWITILRKREGFREAFDGFERTIPDNLYFATMTHYDDDSVAPAAFVNPSVDWPLARALSEHQLKQLHVAETEKYAHVTYYLNGGREEPFSGEEHTLIKSSGTKNFADRPQMEAAAITDTILAAHQQGAFDVCFVNYANADMVGHTGNFDAAVEACAVVDQQLARLYEAIVPAGGALLITADHGNAEEMQNPQTGATQTDHTSNPVPLHFVSAPLQRATPRSDQELAKLLSSPIGVLSDVAPTILDILNIKKPPTMTGISLLSSLQ